MRWGILSALAALMMFAPAADAQEGRIAFDVDGDIWTMRADGSERTRLTDTPGDAESVLPAWSPDGTQIAFVRGGEPTSIWVRDFATGAERRIIRSGKTAIDSEPDWSPDGGTLVFTRLRLSSKRLMTELRTVDLQTGRQRKLASTTLHSTLLFYGTPQFSPDGTRLLYTLTKQDRKSHFAPALYALDLAGGKSRRIAAGGQTGAWSPDGQRIAFSGVRDRNGQSCGDDGCSFRGELYLMNADGSGLTRLTDNKGDDIKPTWTPDGGAIVFQSTRNSPEAGGAELYAVRPDGGCLTWLTNGAAESSYPDWQPGSGGLPAGLGCGAVPREPLLLETPTGRGL